MQKSAKHQFIFTCEIAIEKMIFSCILQFKFKIVFPHTLLGLNSLRNLDIINKLPLNCNILFTVDYCRHKNKPLVFDHKKALINEMENKKRKSHKKCYP